MADELKTQIKYESSRAAQLSKEATREYEANNKARGRELMKQAVEASRKCQKLIEQFNQSTKPHHEEGHHKLTN